MLNHAVPDKIQDVHTIVAHPTLYFFKPIVNEINDRVGKRKMIHIQKGVDTNNVDVFRIEIGEVRLSPEAHLAPKLAFSGCSIQSGIRVPDEVPVHCMPPLGRVLVED